MFLKTEYASRSKKRKQDFRLYYKRRPVETKYQELKEKQELENFSGRLVDNIKQDFYAMMTVSNMLARCLREANKKVQKENRLF
jgi:hypothetical protein